MTLRFAVCQQAEIARLERDSVPMWKGGASQSNSVEIGITVPASAFPAK